MTSPPPKVDGQALFEIFRRYLRDHNLPVTHQRAAIAQALFFADHHVSVGDIERVLRVRGVQVGKATIYRTLDLLREAGLVQEHDFGDGFKRYEPLAAQGHHEHLICTECGRVVEFSSERLERMKSLIAEEYGFRHHHHRLEIYGICRDCQLRDVVTLESQPRARR
ncbi:MAG: transcriptional repressor [Gemmatimonadales bacterium]|nr:transcriptional repressor [Gemmatimonadales bacterium]NIN11212.1 transcriptional repressor [Gemmatimonadales bacterium]NIN49811.1 transcriptional repressor [Gemmatimonadales bacterium]NIP07275.1 transcriptional repressor [Gemmatimonadales bacterium]NIR02970.1 transcriptional repressor [Gemmatimonadales bacterium]